MFTDLINWINVDLVGVVVQLFFLYTIILMLYDKQKPPVQTCVLTGVALIVLAVGGSYIAFATALLGAINGGLWLVVGYQRYRQ